MRRNIVFLVAGLVILVLLVGLTIDLGYGRIVPVGPGKTKQKCSFGNFGYTVYQPGVSNCQDSDGGMFPCVAGSVSWNGGSVADSCTGSTFLSEFKCGSGGNVLEYNIGCAKGCNNDKCVT